MVTRRSGGNKEVWWLQGGVVVTRRSGGNMEEWW